MNASLNALASPYPGLRPFRQDESALFFGRGQQVSDMLVRLEDHRFLAVIGASGCGKSSLVRAGLLPALEQGYLANTEVSDSWHMVVMRPGDAPLRNLALELVRKLRPHTSAAETPLQTALVHAALRSGPKGLVQVVQESHLEENSHVLVLIDQFEEVFRFRQQAPTPDMNGALDAGSAQREEAAEFVALFLATAAQAERPIHVVITMRSDFMGDCDAFHGLPEAINDSQFLTPRPMRDQAQDAVVEPARSLGGDVEPALVNRILNQIGNSPDQLPLMQHVLMRLWNRAEAASQSNEKSTPPILRLEDYKHIGELAGALDKHADAIFDKLPPEQQRIAQVLFRCLSDRNRGVGVGARDIRRPTKLQNIADVAGVSVAQVMQVAEAYRQPGVNFLTPPIEVPLAADTRLDIGHESLLRHWEKLRRWVDNESQSAAIYHRLEETAQSWKRCEHQFLDQAALTYMQAWKKRETPNAAWAERYGGNFPQAMAFLEDSKQELARREAEVRTERERREADERENRKQRDRAKRNKWIIGLTMAGLVVSITLMGWAINSKRIADKKTEEAKEAVLAEKDAKDELSAALVDIKAALKEKDEALRAKVEAERLEKLAAEENERIRKCAEERAQLTQSINLLNPSFAPQGSILTALKALRTIPELEAEGCEPADDATLAAHNALRRSLASLGGVPYYGAKKQGLTNAIAADETGKTKWLVTSNADDGMLQLWEMSDEKDKSGNALPPKKPPTLLPFSDGPPRKLAIARNLLVVQGKTGTFSIWNLAQKDPTKPLFRNTEETWDSFYLSPHENLLRLRYASADKKTMIIKLWDLRPHQPSKDPITLKDQAGNFQEDVPSDFFSFAPNGTEYAIVRRSDGAPTFWKVDGNGMPEGRGKAEDPDSKRRVVNAEFTGNDRLVVCFSDGVVHLWQRGKEWTLKPQRLPISFKGTLDFDVFTDQQGLWAVVVPRNRKDGNPAQVGYKSAPGGEPTGSPKHEAELFNLSEDDLANEKCRFLLDKFNDIDTFELHPIRVSPNRQWLLARLRFDGFRIWALEKPRPPGAEVEQPALTSATIRTQYSRIMHLPSGDSPRFSRDGRWFFQASQSNFVLAWDLWSQNRFGEPNVATLRGHDISLKDYCVSGDSSWLVTLGGDNTVRSWDLKNLSSSIEPREIRNPAGLFTVAMTPSRDWLALSRQDGTLRLWNSTRLDPGEKLTEQPVGEFATLQISEDGRWLLAYRKSATDTGTTKLTKAFLWKLPKTGVPTKYCALDVGRGTVTRLIVDSKALWVAATIADAGKPKPKSLNSSIRIWRVGDGPDNKPRPTELEPLTPEQARGAALAFDDAGKLIKETDTHIEMWDLLKRKTFDEPIKLSRDSKETAWTRPFVTPDGRRAVVFSNSGDATVWDLPSAKEGSSHTLEKSDLLRRDRFFTSTNARWLVNQDGNDFKLWDLVAPRLQKEIKRKTLPESDDNQQQKKAIGFRSLLASPDRNWLLVIDEPGKIGSGAGTLLDLREETPKDCPLANDIATAAFSSDSLRLVTTQRAADPNKDTLRVWDLGDRKKLLQPTVIAWPNSPGIINANFDFRTDGFQNGPVALDAEGDWLAVAGRDNLIRVWNLKEKTDPKVLYGHQLFQPFMLFVTPKGEKVFSVDLEREIIRVSTVSTAGFPELAERMVGRELTPAKKK